MTLFLVYKIFGVIHLFFALMNGNNCSSPFTHQTAEHPVFIKVEAIKERI